MSKYLLKEFFNLCPNGYCDLDLLTEEEKRIKSNGDMLLSGIIQIGDKKNGNGRWYPSKILARELNNYQKVIREQRAVGELDHSDTSVINLKNASHIILRAWMEGSTVYGVLKVLNTPSGQTLKSLVNDGVQVGISSRALGSLTESPQGSIVNEDLQIICWDVVSEPSAPGAYLSLKEAKDYKNNILTKADKIYRALNMVLGK